MRRRMLQEKGNFDEQVGAAKLRLPGLRLVAVRVSHSVTDASFLRSDSSGDSSDSSRASERTADSLAGFR